MVLTRHEEKILLKFLKKTLTEGEQDWSYFEAVGLATLCLICLKLQNAQDEFEEAMKYTE